MKSNVIECPEIVNPYHLDRSGFSDKSFVDDLGLETLLDSVPFFIDAPLARNVIINASDSNTVRYRQDVLEELISNPKLRRDASKVVEKIWTIREKYKEFHNSWRGRELIAGLDLLRSYRDFISERPNLEDSLNSEALREVNSYFQKVKNSDEFKDLFNFISQIDSLKSVELTVSLDHGIPRELYVKGCSDEELADPLFGEKAGDRYRFSFSYIGSNPLKEFLEKYLNNQFISVVESFTPQIEEVLQLSVPLDFYRSFADYFVKLKERGFDICRPTLLDKEKRKMFVKNARNPLLMESKNGHRVVPNDIEYSGESNLFLITGPNNGGKTTYVKTVGLIQLMAQKGLFVPAESAEVSFVDGIYTHFVAPDDITKGEGRYRNELRRMKDIFEGATPYSLVILDEPCGGTSYEEGQRQSLVLLDGFHKLGSATYFTTHMHPLTQEIDNGRYPAGKNLQVECRDDGKKMRYTYKVISGPSGKSFGEEIAREIGLRPRDIGSIISKRAKKNGYRGLLRK